MVGSTDFHPYLQSLCRHYAEWWTLYTLTDIEGKKAASSDEPKRIAPFDFGLMVQSVGNKAPEASRQEKSEKLERQPVLKGLRDSLTETKQVLLIGRPGSGKSTALARLLLEEAQQNQKIIEEPSRIPVLVELRYYQTSVIDLIREFFRRHDLLLETGQVETLLSENRLLLLIDGLNELSSQEAARQDIAKLRNYRHVPMIFTTRDLSLGGDFGIEKQWEMLPLTETQMQEFIRSHLSPEQADDLWRQLKDRTRKFAETPLLLWMLCELFAAGEEIPRNLGEVFRIFTRTYENSSIRKHEVAALKGDVQPLSDRRLWFPALKHLASVMMQGATPVDSRTVISRSEIVQEFKLLFREEPNPPTLARNCLDDLLNYHLLQIKTDDEIEFRHQLIQEYYAAEWLLDRLPELSDEQLKYYFLNCLKWTEAIGLVMGLIDEDDFGGRGREQAIRVVKLALGLETQPTVDLMLGARLAGEVKSQSQEQAVESVLEQIEALQGHELLKIELLGITRSDKSISRLHQVIEASDGYTYQCAVLALEKIGSDLAISVLLETAKHPSPEMRSTAIEALGRLRSEQIIPSLIEAIKDPVSFVRSSAVIALWKIGSQHVIPGLLKALEDSSPIVREYAARALAEVPALLELEQASLEQVVPLLIKVIESERKVVKKDQDDYVSEYIIKTLMRLNLSSINIESFIPFLFEAINHPDDVISIEIAKLLKRTNPDLTHHILCRLNQALKGPTVIFLAEILLDNSQKSSELKRLKMPRTVAWQETNLDASEDDIKIDFQLFIAQLTQKIECLDDSIREDAVYVLSHINSENFVKKIFSIQSDQHVQEVLQQVIQELSKAIHDSNYNIRRIAAYSLEKIGNPQSLSALWQQKIKFPDQEIDKAILSIQERCQFYNYEIAQSDPPPAVKQESGVGNQGQTIFNIETLNANNSVLNLGGNVRDQIIRKPEP